MPVGSIIVTTDATSNQGSALIGAEKGYLTAVSLQPEQPGLGNAEAFGQIFLVSTETPNPVRLIGLASGYMGASVIFSWTGRIQLEPAMAVQAYVYSDAAFNFMLNVLTEI